MAEPAFDTLTIAKELERDYGFETKQAEGAAVMIHRHLVGNVATKDDLRQVVKDLTGQMEHLATKEELKEEITQMKLATKEEVAKLATKEEMVQLEDRVIMKMTIRLGGIMIGALAFFEVLNRVFPIAGG